MLYDTAVGRGPPANYAESRWYSCKSTLCSVWAVVDSQVSSQVRQRLTAAVNHPHGQCS